MAGKPLDITGDVDVLIIGVCLVGVTPLFFKSGITEPISNGPVGSREVNYSLTSAHLRRRLSLYRIRAEAFIKASSSGGKVEEEALQVV
jgi:hypothetical protein